MLISPKHKFIFFKNMKCAGSSIELSLLKYCTKDALCTGGTSSNEGPSYDEYEPRNNRFSDGKEEWIRFHSHTWPSLFFSKIKNKKTFNDYRKITVVRNPWEQVVSFYWWTMQSALSNPIKKNQLINKHNSKIEAQKKFKMWLNTLYDFESPVNGEHDKIIKKPVDFLSFISDNFIDDVITDYIMYENLQKDYNLLISKMMLSTKVTEKLSKLKSENKKIKNHYSFYYNSKSKEQVEKAFLKTIKNFNYKFQKE